MNATEREGAPTGLGLGQPSERLTSTPEQRVMPRISKVTTVDLAIQQAREFFYSTRRRLNELAKIPVLDLNQRREQAELKVRFAWLSSELRDLSPEDRLTPSARTEILRGLLKEPGTGDYLNEQITLQSGEKKTRMVLLREDVANLLKYTGI